MFRELADVFGNLLNLTGSYNNLAGTVGLSPLNQAPLSQGLRATQAFEQFFAVIRTFSDYFVQHQRTAGGSIFSGPQNSANDLAGLLRVPLSNVDGNPEALRHLADPQITGLIPKPQNTTYPTVTGDRMSAQQWKNLVAQSNGSAGRAVVSAQTYGRGGQSYGSLDAYFKENPNSLSPA